MSTLSQQVPGQQLGAVQFPVTKNRHDGKDLL